MQYRAYQEKIDGTDIDRVVLEGPGSSCMLTPGIGMNLYSWVVDGRELMMSTQDVTAGGYAYGNPILFPTPNRMRDATYTFEGETRKVTLNGEDVLIHGLVTDAAFDAKCWADDKGAYCEGTLEFKEGGYWVPGYPYACTLTVKFTLCEKGIVFDVNVKNQSGKNMPFGFAIHPYFSKMGDPSAMAIQVPVDQHYDVTEDLLPTGKLIDVKDGDAFDLRKPRLLSNTDLDTVFRGMNSKKTARIEYRHWGKALTINSDDAFNHAVVYTPPYRPGFCFEPQTCSTDAINLYAKGLEEQSSLMILKDGEAWAGQIRMLFEAL